MSSEIERYNLSAQVDSPRLTLLLYDDVTKHTATISLDQTADKVLFTIYHGSRTMAKFYAIMCNDFLNTICENVEVKQISNRKYEVELSKEDYLLLKLKYKGC